MQCRRGLNYCLWFSKLLIKQQNVNCTFSMFFHGKKYQRNWWILIPLALASGRHCWQVEDSRGSTTCGHHAEWHQCLLCAETLWQWTSHGRDRGIFWEASWMCFFARFLFFLSFMVQQKSPSIFNLEGWDSEYEFTTQIFFLVPVFFRFKNPMARVQADSHFGAGRLILNRFFDVMEP